MSEKGNAENINVKFNEKILMQNRICHLNDIKHKTLRINICS